MTGWLTAAVRACCNAQRTANWGVSPGSPRSCVAYFPICSASFGFSLHEMDFYTELFVNGVSINNLKRLLPSGSTRGGYVRIDAAPGEVIYSVKVANHANTATSDALAFDHVAFAPFPR